MVNEFDITAFGAVGDGKTDCTAAIQKALDAAAECHGLVTVPPGDYATGKLHVHGSGVCVRGFSGWAYHVEGASVLRLNDENADCLIDLTGGFGATLQGLGLVGGKLGENVHGILLHWDRPNGGGQEDTFTVDDCRVDGFSGDGIHLDHVWAFTLRHSMLIFNKGNGMWLEGFDGFISDTMITANEQWGVSGIAASLTFTGNRVEWNRKGGFFFPFGDSMNITGNFFDRSFGPALELGSPDSGMNNTAVTGNLFRRSGAYYAGQEEPTPERSCHIRMTNGKGVTITGNTFRSGRDDGRKGIVTPEYGIRLGGCVGCICQMNTLTEGAGTQLIVEESENPDSLISNNVGTLFNK